MYNFEDTLKRICEWDMHFPALHCSCICPEGGTDISCEKANNPFICTVVLGGTH